MQSILHKKYSPRSTLLFFTSWLFEARRLYIILSLWFGETLNVTSYNLTKQAVLAWRFVYTGQLRFPNCVSQHLINTSSAAPSPFYYFGKEETYTRQNDTKATFGCNNTYRRPDDSCCDKRNGVIVARDTSAGI